MKEVKVMRKEPREVIDSVDVSTVKYYLRVGSDKKDLGIILDNDYNTKEYKTVCFEGFTYCNHWSKNKPTLRDAVEVNIIEESGIKVYEFNTMKELMIYAITLM